LDDPYASSVDKKINQFIVLLLFSGLTCGAGRNVIASYPFGRCSFPDTFIAGFFANRLLAMA